SNITAGPDGNLWFTERSGTIGRITPTGVITEFALPGGVPGGLVWDITVGSDGALWYTRPVEARVGRITTNGVIGEATMPVANSNPNFITTGPDGNLWFTDDSGHNLVGTFAPFTPDRAPAEVRHVSPPNGLPGGGTRVIISGINLQKATGVSFGGTPATSFTVIDAGHVAATSPAHAIGAVDVTVTTPAGTTAPFPGAQFFYSSPRCGKIITASTTLTSDIGPCFGDGVIIRADDITLDLGGHSIYGFAPPSDGNAAGVRLATRTGVTVRNGAITGFDGGVFLNRGSGNTVSGLNIHDNIGPDDPSSTLGDGIALFNSANNVIANDTVAHNGHYDGIGCLGDGCNGNSIHDNVVENNIGPASRGPGGEGIIITNFLNSNNLAAIAHNDVIGNAVRGNGAAGISNINNTEATVGRNLVEGNGLTNQIGNGIGVSVGPRALQPDTHMTIRDNIVRHNGDNGVVIASGAQSNNVLANVSTDNNARGQNYRDLKDENATCDSNVWDGNTWGSAGYDPPCVTVNGSGPAPPAAAAAAVSL
ncbi:MAG: right-handed parallel beta-helix repeat-containing protein, partial [Actinobacteria bacterium]|nr:right-handed parallel beta-helix repeat-containing protein [Actinomycetota bacterium]